MQVDSMVDFDKKYEFFENHDKPGLYFFRHQETFFKTIQLWI